MTELSVLERVQMCVAEAGYDPALVGPGSTPWSLYSYKRRLPYEVVWRARETVGTGRPRCWECAREYAALIWALPRRGCEVDPTAPEPVVSCLAERRFMQDCGRERAEP